MTIRPARDPDEMPMVRELLREYAVDLGISLCFQNFDAELATLPGAYAPPAGRLLVADAGTELAGCVALRPNAPGIAELKRLFVRPKYRGQGIGRDLLDRITAEAVAAGYREAVFDTLPVMTVALGMYRKAGFVESEPYTFNPVPGAMYFRKTLQPKGG
jgi:GNAT superfamily N-acetyltransferase